MSLTLKNMSVKPGQDLKITGVPKPDAEGFSVNIGHSDNDIALHFNVRFNQHGDHHVIVFNSRQGGSWSSEQRERNFPFEQGEEFKVTINYNSDEFHVKIPGDHTVSFPNRFGEDKFMYIEVLGDVKIKGFKIN